MGNISSYSGLANRRLSTHIFAEGTKRFVVVKELRRVPCPQTFDRHAIVGKIELLQSHGPKRRKRRSSGLPASRAGHRQAEAFQLRGGLGGLAPHHTAAPRV